MQPVHLAKGDWTGEGEEGIAAVTDAWRPSPLMRGAKRSDARMVAVAVVTAPAILGLVTSLPWKKPPERAAGRVGAGGENLGTHLVNVAVAQDARVLSLRWADIMAVEQLTRGREVPVASGEPVSFRGFGAFVERFGRVMHAQVFSLSNY